VRVQQAEDENDNQGKKKKEEEEEEEESQQQERPASPLPSAAIYLHRRDTKELKADNSPPRPASPLPPPALYQDRRAERKRLTSGEREEEEDRPELIRPGLPVPESPAAYNEKTSDTPRSFQTSEDSSSDSSSSSSGSSDESGSEGEEESRPRVSKKGPTRDSDNEEERELVEHSRMQSSKNIDSDDEQERKAKTAEANRRLNEEEGMFLH
jgi:hypothetical protein